MQNKKTKLNIEWIRALLFIIALIVCIILVIWKFNRSWIDQVDNIIINSYIGHYSKRLDRAILMTSKEPEKGLQQLKNLIVDLADVKKLDRLDGIKRSAFNKIIIYLENSGQNDESLYWAERYLEFDERDLFAQVWRARLMDKSKDKTAKGWPLINELYNKLPNSVLIAEEYAEFLIRRRKFADAFIAAYKATSKRESLSGRLWQFFWDVGDNFNAKQMKNVLPEIDVVGNLTFTISVPTGTRRIRIDLPSNPQINLLNPILVDKKTPKKRKYLILEDSLRVNQMLVDKNMIKANLGDDPYFYFECINNSNEFLELQFCCNAKENLASGVVEKIMKQSDPNTVIDDLMKKGCLEYINVFNEIINNLKNQNTESRFFELFWKNSKEDFSQKNKLRKIISCDFERQGCAFDIFFDVDTVAEYMRIDFPDIVGKKYIIYNIKTIGDGWSRQVDLSEIDDRQINMLAHKEEVFFVVGKDPYFVFPTDSYGKDIRSVVIRGRVH